MGIFEELNKQGIMLNWAGIEKDSLDSNEYSLISCCIATIVERYKYELFIPNKDAPYKGHSETGLHSFLVRAEVDNSYKFHSKNKRKIDIFIDYNLYTDKTKTKTRKCRMYTSLFSRYLYRVAKNWEVKKS